MRWRVMRALNLPVNDPRVSTMSELQLLWSYLNVIQDDDEEEQRWEARLDYLASFANADAVRNIVEERKAIREQHKAKLRKQPLFQNQPNQHNQQTETQQVPVNHQPQAPQRPPLKDGYASDDFALEIRAAQLGYTPELEISAAEFLKQHAPNVLAEPLDNATPLTTLLEDGPYTELTASATLRGNFAESADDFLRRVAAWGEHFAQQEQVQEQQGLSQEVDDGLDIVEVEIDED